MDIIEELKELLTKAVERGEPGSATALEQLKKLSIDRIDLQDEIIMLREEVDRLTAVIKGNHDYEG